MNKQDIYEYLDNKKIWHEITEHKAVYNMKEVAEIEVPYPEQDAKNLFVRDDKKRNYYLITVKGNKRVDLKEFRKRYETRPLSFASEEDLNVILKLIPGAVSPFGLLNDDQKKTVFCIDKDYIGGNQLIGIHPNDNTATVWLKVDDLLNIFRNNNIEIMIVDVG